MKNKRKKKIIKIIAIALAVILAIVLSYMLYVVLSYYRVEDNQKLSVGGNQTEITPVGEELSLVTYNIGFGAYSPDYSFFMDGGEYSRGLSKSEVEGNVIGAGDVIKELNPSFILLQEVDKEGTRSHDVNQVGMMNKTFPNHGCIYAQNYDSPYFLYPILSPIGANESGIMTFSKYNVTSSVRRSLPIEESLYKYLDLDRCYTKTTLKTDNGKELILYNVHLSAYTSDGTIADKQLEMLSDDMNKEYKKGNYCIAAGDFNKDLLGDSGKYFKRSEGEFNWAKPFDTSKLPKGFKINTGSNAPSCRNADSAFKGDGTDFVLSVDGVITSANVEVKKCETVDISFEYSDHNPVFMEFSLINNQ